MIIYLRLSFIRRSTRQKKLRDIWEPIILDYLSTEINLDKTIKRLNVSHHDLYFFTDFTSEYLGSLAGSEYEQLIKLLKKLNLADFEVKKLRRRNVWIRVFALNHLGLIKEKRTIPEIKKSLKDSNPLIFYAAAEALSSMQDADSFDEVAATLLVRPYWNKIRTAEIFLKYGRAAAARLVKFLDDENITSDRKALVIDILGEFKATEMAEELLRLGPRTDDVNIKVSIIKYLGKITYLNAKQFLIASLDDEDWVVRGQAAKSLGFIGVPEAVNKLAFLLKDKVWWVRYLSAQSLANIGREGWARLEQAKHSPDKFARDVSAQIISEMRLNV
ncbi:MAG TPA: HEAT repeat domain-containing protein [Actinobacteria bacterium]|nr:HEAT repeat domain-containing protein [Actinomycetes bacterium]HEX21648.1 HEAT repeat domain-containing protein [Actinomycetota bacterium]